MNKDKLNFTDDFSSRIKWTRLQLEITLDKVADMVPMSKGTLHALEKKSKTTMYDKIYRLASIYNELWQEKFKARSPRYHNGEQIGEITITWLFFGFNEKSKYDEAYKNLKKDHYNEVLALKERIWELEATQKKLAHVLQS
jgi:transcriptional regulator with XRE-family HTH domain